MRERETWVWRFHCACLHNWAGILSWKLLRCSWRPSAQHSSRGVAIATRSEGRASDFYYSSEQPCSLAAMVDQRQPWWRSTSTNEAFHLESTLCNYCACKIRLQPRTQACEADRGGGGALRGALLLCRMLVYLPCLSIRWHLHAPLGHEPGKQHSSGYTLSLSLALPSLPVNYDDLLTQNLDTLTNFHAGLSAQGFLWNITVQDGNWLRTLIMYIHISEKQPFCRDQTLKLCCIQAIISILDL